MSMARFSTDASLNRSSNVLHYKLKLYKLRRRRGVKDQLLKPRAAMHEASVPKGLAR